MSEPTQSRVHSYLDAMARGGTLMPIEAQGLCESWLRQRERIAALERLVHGVGLRRCDGEIYGIGPLDWSAHGLHIDHPSVTGIDAAMRALDAEVARCYGIEHP
jgi:hypothetical protein